VSRAWSSVDEVAYRPDVQALVSATAQPTRQIHRIFDLEPAAPDRASMIRTSRMGAEAIPSRSRARKAQGERLDGPMRGLYSRPG